MFNAMMLEWYLKPRVEQLNLLGSSFFFFFFGRYLVMIEKVLHKLLQS